MYKNNRTVLSEFRKEQKMNRYLWIEAAVLYGYRINNREGGEQYGYSESKSCYWDKFLGR